MCTRMHLNEPAILRLLQYFFLYHYDSVIEFLCMSTDSIRRPIEVSGHSLPPDKCPIPEQVPPGTCPPLPSPVLVTSPINRPPHEISKDSQVFNMMATDSDDGSDEEIWVAYLGGPCSYPLFGGEFFVLRFNVKKLMLNFEQ